MFKVAKEVDEENDESAKPAEKKSRFKKPKLSAGGILALIPKLLIGLNVLGMGLGGYLAYMGTIGMTPETIREAKAKELLYNEEIFQGKPVIYALEPFTVNLADTEDDRVVQVKVTLEMLDEIGFEEVVSMGAHARDEIVTILNGKKFFDLQTIQGKLFLKDEITVALNKQLKRSFIKDVYFSRFVLQ
jgi:flagellar protein FliL